MMKYINLFLTMLAIVVIISCEKDNNSCDCNPENNFDTIIYRLDSVIDLSFQIYTSAGIKYPLDNFDTLIRYSFYLYFSGTDSIYLTSSNAGEYFGHYKFLEDTLVSRSLFSYTREENTYKFIPVNYSSTVIIDPNEEDHVRALNYGEDDEEIIENQTRTYTIDGEQLTIQLYELRLSRGSTTIYFPAQTFNEEITDDLGITEELTVIKYKLTYKRE